MLQNPGGLDRLGVMSRAPGRLGDPQEPAGQVGDDLEVHPGPPVLAREEPLFAVPVPTRGKSAVDDHLLGGVEVLHRWDEFVENLAESGCPAGHDPADRGLGDAEVLSTVGLGPVPSDVRDGDLDLLTPEQDRRPSPGPVTSGEPVGDPLVEGIHCHGRESCCRVHVRACSRRLFFNSPIVARTGPPRCHHRRNERKTPKKSRMTFE